MNIEQALLLSTARLKEANIASAALDARLLISYVLNESIEYLSLNSSKVLAQDTQKKILELVDERSSLKPLAYILGYKEFYGRTFKLSDRVLIPRPDTETLIDAVLSQLTVPNPRILELGCGSGCIIISLLLEIPKACGVTCDINPDAISISQENARLHNVERRLEIIESNWFDNIKSSKFDIIVCNPPYISQHEEALMSQETILFEPHLALFASDQGLEAYKIIANRAAEFLNATGELFFEISFNQLEAVKEIFASNGFSFKAAYKDLKAHYRVVNFTLCG